MNLFKRLFVLLFLFAGMAKADTDLQKRQQCISKCLNKSKPKVFRPFHRMVCKMHCSTRHGMKIAEEKAFVHPGFNGKDSMFAD